MNPYKILGINESANEEEIRTAYRKLVLQYHPDRNIGDAEATEKFKQIQQAYEIITKKQPGASFNFGFEDIFDQFFGFRHQKPQTRGRNILSEYEIDFIQAAKGCNIEINIRSGTPCKECSGHGFKNVITCPVCHGQKVVQYRQGNVSIQTTCQNCAGNGVSKNDPCNTCSGEGVSKETIPIMVKINKGTHDGYVLVLNGKGEQKGDIPGDAYVKIKVRKHPIFDYRGNDLIVKVPINYYQAVFGDTITIPTIDGKQEIVIPPETISGNEIRIDRTWGTELGFGRGGGLIAIIEIDTTMPKEDKLKNNIKKLNVKTDKMVKFGEYLDEVN